MYRRLILKPNKLSADASAIIENFLSLGLLQGISALLPLVALPYVASTLGRDNFGLVSLASAVIAYLHVLVDYGFKYTATRDVAVSREDQAKVNAIFSTVIVTKSLLFGIACLILLAALWLIPEAHANFTLFIITLSFVPATILCADWLLQGLERMRYLAIAGAVGKIGATSMIFVLVKDPSDYLWIPALNAIGYWITALIALYIINKERMITQIIRPDFMQIKHTLREGFNVFLNALAPNSYNSLGTILLGAYAGPAQVGLLDAAKRLTDATSLLNELMSRVFFPYVSRQLGGIKYLAVASIGPALVISLFLFFFASPIVGWLYSPEYSTSVLPLQILAFSPLALAIGNVFGVNYFIPRRRSALLRNITLGVSLVGLTLALALVPLLGLIGAAIALAGARILKAGVCLLAANHVRRQPT